MRGAGSIDNDKNIRLENGWPWYPDEEITDADVDRTIGLGPVDILITHSPPQRIVTKHWDTPEGLRQ